VRLRWKESNFLLFQRKNGERHFSNGESKSSITHSKKEQKRITAQ
jgi:hypothetical protein